MRSRSPGSSETSSELKANPPDFVLVASDGRMLKLASPLGDEAAAEQIVEAALARIARVAEVAGAATGRPVILQTLAGDPDAIQVQHGPRPAGQPALSHRRIQPRAWRGKRASNPVWCSTSTRWPAWSATPLVGRTLLVCREISVRDRHDPALRRQRHADSRGANGAFAPGAGARPRQHDVGRHRRRRRHRRSCAGQWQRARAKPIRRCSGWRCR